MDSVESNVTLMKKKRYACAKKKTSTKCRSGLSSRKMVKAQKRGVKFSMGLIENRRVCYGAVDTRNLRLKSRRCER